MYARDYAEIATPIGLVRVEGGEQALTAIRIGGDDAPAKGSAAAVRAAVEQLEQWFAHEREDFQVSLEPTGTPRGEALRAGLIAVGYGDTRSYGHWRGSSDLARAIGRLCARNPFPILVHCHRVLGSGGALGHYSAGDGPKTKSWLLEHERRDLGGTLL